MARRRHVRATAVKLARRPTHDAPPAVPGRRADPPELVRDERAAPDHFPQWPAHDPSLDTALALIAAVAQQARRLGCRQTIVVVDVMGDIVAQARMDGAWRDAGDLALTKAAAACAFDLETRRLGETDHPGIALFRGTFPAMSSPAGGVPLHRDGVVVGGVGVAGGDPDEDQACAEAAAAVTL